MKKVVLLNIVLMFVLIFQVISFASEESFDRVIAVVNNFPIVESEIESKFQQIKKKGKIKKGQESVVKSKIIDAFIENLLVTETATDQSIIVNDTKVLLGIERQIDVFLKKKGLKKDKLKNMTKSVSLRIRKIRNEERLPKEPQVKKFTDEFINFLVKSQALPFDQIFEEIRVQMTKEQVMSIAIGITPPKKSEALKWYKKNKKKLGYEFSAKHIILIPKNNGFAEQKRVSKQLKQIRAKALKGQSFEKLAKKYSQGPSKVKGGDLGWFMLGDMDRYFANAVYQMRKRGQISQPVKTSFGYHIIKYIGKRATSFKNVERKIMYMIYNENMMKQFKKWIANRKKESEIIIYYKSYKKS